jgi:2-haloacid dehalogenase
MPRTTARRIAVFDIGGALIDADRRLPSAPGGDGARPIPGTAGILERPKARGPVRAITSFSAGKLRPAQRRFDAPNLFDGMAVSGFVGLLKPDPAIYRRLLDGCGPNPAETLFIDDAEASILGARAVGMHAHHFTGSDSLLLRLRSSGLP